MFNNCSNLSFLSIINFLVLESCICSSLIGCNIIPACSDVVVFKSFNLSCNLLDSSINVYLVLIMLKSLTHITICIPDNGSSSLNKSLL